MTSAADQTETAVAAASTAGGFQNVSTKPEKSLIFELSKPGRVAYSLPPLDVPEVPVSELIPASMLRATPAGLPEVYEVDVVRHYTELSRRNFGVDNGFYPLGSCTMKYNPKINEDTARFAGFAKIHPYQPEESIQGALELLHTLQHDLAALTGMDQVTLQPAAGAHGEWTGLMMIRAYHESHGESRTKVIVPDSSHGTNPASATVAGFETVTIKSNERGMVDLDALRAAVGADTAALMLTNPSTLGLFEEQIVEIAQIVHDAGGLLYYDGANSNAIMGITRPGDMGFDVVHLNLHKTMSTPHGGGGPGAGPVGVKAKLMPFLPKPLVARREDGSYFFDYDIPQSIGRVKAYYGNFGILVRAYTYIRTYGPDGLRRVSECAVLNANYMMARLAPHYEIPYPGVCKHEFVMSGRGLKAFGVRTLDVAKRLLDFGYHPPTIYFPLNVEECIMIEPTETESKETLDGFIDTMIRIAEEARTTPDIVLNAPYDTVVRRLDETTAARKPVLNCACS
ncbi:glycine dehydrogenase subunit 2 [Cohnella fermenti]|uniref:Probable glycine dehydrogenase (decarboxylating) subunit 2 n=2 Tax=Cohnella fermenti TaxID=2565925 RepID=A0A4S4BQX3_9BACL|nr:glycine dehydrogenase subunit 2 [Cohnella fermenti]